jgi:hypothetical protein
MAEKAQEQVQRIHQLLRAVKILPREIQSGCKENHQTVKFSGPGLLMTRVAKCSPLNENVLMMKGPRPTPKKQGTRCSCSSLRENQLLLVKTLRLFIFFCGVSPLYLIPPMLLALNAASLDHNCSRDGAGQQKYKWGPF